MKERIARRLWLAAALAAAAGLCFAPLPGARPARASPSIAVRLFGPIASLAASAQWVRADLAFRAGRVELYLARARTALALAPEAAGGWTKLARDQSIVLASPEREPDPLRRLAWVRAGLATAAEGERAVPEKGALAFLAGELLIKVPMVDRRLPWPGGMAAVLEAAAEHFERAKALGFDPRGLSTIMADAVRKQAVRERGGR